MIGALIAVVEKTTTDVLKLKELDEIVVKFHCGDREWERFGGRAHDDFLACLHFVAINCTVTHGWFWWEVSSSGKDFTAVNSIFDFSSMAFFAIGLAVLLGQSLLIPIDGCSINPNRPFGPLHLLLTPSQRTATNISFGTHTCISFSSCAAEFVAMTLFVNIEPGSAIGIAKTEGSAWVLQVSLVFGFASTQGLGSNRAGEGWSFNVHTWLIALASRSGVAHWRWSESSDDCVKGQHVSFFKSVPVERVEFHEIHANLDSVVSKNLVERILTSTSVNHLWTEGAVAPVKNQEQCNSYSSWIVSRSILGCNGEFMDNALVQQPISIASWSEVPRNTRTCRRQRADSDVDSDTSTSCCICHATQLQQQQQQQQQQSQL